ncbi:MAG TPA: hypothetical protein VK498_11360 [Ferruginibacter sp.]|nr:hypothetical protein [Ferruginibacter sp.]
MKFIISLVLIALLSFAACLYLPWWSIAIAAFIVGALIPLRPAAAFFAGFFALFLLWSLESFWLSSNNGHILAHKLSMLIIKMDNPILLIIVTGLIGAIVAGFASLSGSFLQPKKK